MNELVLSVQGHKDKGRTREALLLYGFGDGGGGPAPEMLERAQLLANVEGLPQVWVGPGIRKMKR